MSSTQIIRLYTREMGAKIADTTLDPKRDAEVVLEVEAGDGAWVDGALFQAELTIIDIDDEGKRVLFVPTNPTPASATGYAGSMGNVPWDNQAQPLSFTIAKAELERRKGHLCKAYGKLLVGAVQVHPAAYFIESPLFLIRD